MKSFVSTVTFLLVLTLPSAGIAQISLNKTADMTFGILGYDLPHSGNVQLGTNGNVAISGGSGLAHNGGESAASVSVTGTPQDVIEVKCKTSGNLILSGGNKIPLQNPEIAVDSGVPFGSGSACQGNKKNSTPATTVDLAVNNNPVILMGAELVISANSLASGTYTTTNGGGKAVTLTIVFQ